MKKYTHKYVGYARRDTTIDIYLSPYHGTDLMVHLSIGAAEEGLGLVTSTLEVVVQDTKSERDVLCGSNRDNLENGLR